LNDCLKKINTQILCRAINDSNFGPKKMEHQAYSSEILEAALDEFSKLPGIGKKSALRMVMHLLRQSKEEGRKFGETVIK
jgi:hypothetical protein